MDVYAAEDAAVEFQFIVNGEFVVPSSASFTVRDNAGVPFSDLTDVVVSIGASATQTIVTIPGAKNTVANGKLFENRTVEAKFSHQGNTYRIRHSYRVTPFLTYTVTVEDVRSALGVLQHELSEDDADVLSAYYMVLERVGEPLNVALVAGDLTTQYANWAIMYRAALNVLPSLRLRAAVAQGDDNITFERFAKMDFDALEDACEQGYEDAVWSMIPVANRPLVKQLVFLAVSAPVDVITGV